MKTKNILVLCDAVNREYERCNKIQPLKAMFDVEYFIELSQPQTREKKTVCKECKDRIVKQSRDASFTPARWKIDPE